MYVAIRIVVVEELYVNTEYVVFFVLFLSAMVAVHYVKNIGDCYLHVKILNVVEGVVFVSIIDLEQDVKILNVAAGVVFVSICVYVLYAKILNAKEEVLFVNICE